MRFQTWTGPVTAAQVALRLSEAGLKGVSAGTEHVYFRLPTGREMRCEAGYDAKLAEAQGAVDEVFPYASYRVTVASYERN